MDVALCIQIRHTPYKQKNILQPFCVEMLMKMFGTEISFFSPFFSVVRTIFEHCTNVDASVYGKFFCHDY